MADFVRSFLGDKPGRVAVRLLVFSLIVGIVMSMFGLTPMDIVHWISRFFNSLWNMGFSAFQRVGEYILIGAAIVVPIFIILRILNWRKE